MNGPNWFANEGRLLGFAALALVIVGSSAGNVLLKIGARAGAHAANLMFGLVAWQTLAGIASFSLGVLAYAWALKQFDLHSAQIVVSLQYVSVILLSYFVLGERIASNEWLGMALIALGLFVCAR
jgi:drug/metabolite transporter (DMT)-like permease